MKVADIDTQTLSQGLSGSDDMDLGPKLKELFARWMMDPPEQMVLLGLPHENLEMQREYEKDGPTVNGHILIRFGLHSAIHRDLRAMFPHSREMPYIWMHEINESFSGMSPMRFIAEKGLEGLVIVAEALEFSSAARACSSFS